MEPTRFFFVYVTCSTEEEAAKLGATLVKERLAACVNILGPIRSIYEWKGELRDEREVAMIAKTAQPLVEELTARVREMHSYDCPCVVALPIAAGNPAFLDWIGAQTGSAP